MMMLGFASLKKIFLFYFWDTDPLETNGVQWRHGAVPSHVSFPSRPVPAKESWGRIQMILQQYIETKSPVL